MPPGVLLQALGSGARRAHKRGELIAEESSSADLVRRLREQGVRGAETTFISSDRLQIERNEEIRLLEAKIKRLKKEIRHEVWGIWGVNFLYGLAVMLFIVIVSLAVFMVADFVQKVMESR